jgi:hypothetical protein
MEPCPPALSSSSSATYMVSRTAAASFTPARHRQLLAKRRKQHAGLGDALSTSTSLLLRLVVTRARRRGSEQARLTWPARAKIINCTGGSGAYYSGRSGSVSLGDPASTYQYASPEPARAVLLHLVPPHVAIDNTIIAPTSLLSEHF